MFKPMDRIIIVGTLKNPFLITALIFAGIFLFMQAGASKPVAPKITGEGIGKPHGQAPALPLPVESVSKIEKNG